MFFPKSYSLYSTTPLYLVTIFNAHMDIFEIICTPFGHPFFTSTCSASLTLTGIN
nr:MAG TPA: hypothetical protein [Crassvirales sp.]